MRQTLLLLFIFSLHFSCDSNGKTSGEAFIGGEIVNPNNDYLILYDINKAVDTLYLDENNRFSYNVSDLKSGLHYFAHGGESQIVLLEPQDSVLIRLNTLEFDESLVFSGKGSKKNNYLISLFMTQESEFRDVFQYSKLNPKVFQSKLDSIRSKKYTKLNAFNEKYDPSDLFKKITKANIDYNYYRNKELYCSWHFGNNKIIDHSLLPSDFFDFRKDVNYNNEDLEAFYPYRNFLFPHFNNLAKDRYFKNNKGETILNRRNIEYNLIKLQLMDSLIQSKSMRNRLMRDVTRSFLSNSYSIEDSEAMYNSFVAKNTNERYADQINDLYNTQKRLQPGRQLPEVEIINSNNEMLTISSVAKEKPTVIYFWENANANQFINSHEKANRFRKEYPNVNFIAINISQTSNYSWKRILAQHDYELTNEYKFRNPRTARHILAVNSVSKVIVIDTDNTIITSNTSLFRQDILNILKKIN
ncbi:hypothetical protein D7030_05175 [Flavobacteriaceae bacterium AU392]|nr:hypothetical protein D1817_11650 [Flavobacteriaceae bacterium]RKM86069.1 hypothetical protein D7030_05175 [Flavobacteriaceae bacterium AU392]